jgi:predicted MFS family arabinose efflux permease
LNHQSRSRLAINEDVAVRTPAASALSPLRHTAFAVLWAATVVSNVGTWMNDVAAGWLMTTLTSSPLLVALVQTATTLPVFLFALPGGALADIVDRRKLLIAVQVTLALIILTLGLLVLFEGITPLLLLLFVALAGTGGALIAPAWQAIVPRLVPREDLQAAIALNSVGINISRAIGPALGGLIIAAFGIAWPFLLNALSFLGIIVALLWWRQRAAPGKHLPAEHFVGAMRTGLRYVRYSAPLRATLVRAVAFFVFASALWGLMPLIARDVLDGGAQFYGLLLANIGAGAVGGAFLLPRLKAMLGADRLVALGTLGTALVLLIFALAPAKGLAIAASGLAGVSWIAVLSSLNVSAQLSLPDWVRARGLAVFVMVFFGSMSSGSILWGQTASALGIPTALVIAAVGSVLAIPLSWRWKLQRGQQADLSPSMHWPAPVVTGEIAHDRGPVLVTVEYRVDAADRNAFLTAMTDVCAQRRRDGAFAWGVFEDAADRGRYIEHFIVESWLEHLRQHERVTQADRAVQAQIRGFHRGDKPPTVTHLLAARPDDAKPQPDVAERMEPQKTP